MLLQESGKGIFSYKLFRIIFKVEGNLEHFLLISLSWFYIDRAESRLKKKLMHAMCLSSKLIVLDKMVSKSSYILMSFVSQGQLGAA